MDTSKLPTHLLVNTKANFRQLMCLHSGCVKTWGKSKNPIPKLKTQTPYSNPNPQNPIPKSQNSIPKYHPHAQSQKYSKMCPNQSSRY